MSLPKHPQADYGPRLKVHADNRGAGINREIWGVRGLRVGGGITAPGPMLNTIPSRQRMSKTKLPSEDWRARPL